MTLSEYLTIPFFGISMAGPMASETQSNSLNYPRDATPGCYYISCHRTSGVSPQQTSVVTEAPTH